MKKLTIIAGAALFGLCVYTPNKIDLKSDLHYDKYAFGNYKPIESLGTTQNVGITAHTNKEKNNLEDIVHVNDSTFEKEVLKSDLPVVVDFYATWCGPCKWMAPHFSELSRFYAEKMKFAKLDIDPNTIDDKYGIDAIPTLIVFKKGKEITRNVGYLDKDELQKFIEDSLKKCNK